jgi:tetratricopeptide (TPR) repeat protein
MKLYRKPLFWIAAAAAVVLLFYYFPNLFVSGRVLYEFGVEKCREADHGDYNDGDKMKRAAFYFEKAISSGFTQRDIYERLSGCYWKLGDKVKVEYIYSLGIKQYPNDVDFYFYRGQCRKELKDAQGAFEDYDEVIRLNLNYKYISEAYYDRGAMRYVLGDTLGAEADRLQTQKLVGSEWRTYEDYTYMLGFHSY